MPKIIENLRERVLKTAREALVTEGYQALSMRALAQRVGVAPGTLYNHFRDKEEIVATLALADWQGALARMDAAAARATDLERGLAALCDELSSFSSAYRPTWEQYEGGRAAGYLTRYHRTLREQVARPARTVLERSGRADLAPLADVLAEVLLVCSVNEDLGTASVGKLAAALAAGAQDVTGRRSGDDSPVPLSHDEGGEES